VIHSPPSPFFSLYRRSIPSNFSKSPQPPRRGCSSPPSNRSLPNLAHLAVRRRVRLDLRVGLAAPVEVARARADGGALKPPGVLLADLLEEDDVGAPREEHERKGADGRVAPALLEKAAALVEMRKLVLLRRAADEIEVDDLKVVPVVAGARDFVLRGVGDVPALDDVVDEALFLSLLDDRRPEARDRVHLLVHPHDEALSAVRPLHLSDWVVDDVAELADVRVEAPRLVLLAQDARRPGGAREEAAHLALGFRVALVARGGENAIEALAVDPFGHAPLALREEVEADARGRRALDLVQRRLRPLDFRKEDVVVLPLRVLRRVKGRHRLHEVVRFRLAHEDDERDARRPRALRRRAAAARRAGARGDDNRRRRRRRDVRVAAAAAMAVAGVGARAPVSVALAARAAAEGRGEVVRKERRGEEPDESLQHARARREADALLDSLAPAQRDRHVDARRQVRGMEREMGRGTKRSLCAARG
jgi:hypothetical protein